MMAFIFADIKCQLVVSSSPLSKLCSLIPSLFVVSHPCHESRRAWLDTFQSEFTHTPGLTSFYEMTSAAASERMFVSRVRVEESEDMESGQDTLCCVRV